VGSEQVWYIEVWCVFAGRLVTNSNADRHAERKVKDHLRSIHKVSASSIVTHYCITGSSDGDLRVWVSSE
jgi:hypothetical protein